MPSISVGFVCLLFFFSFVSQVGGQWTVLLMIACVVLQPREKFMDKNTSWVGFA